MGVLSPEACAGVSVTKNEVAWSDLQFRMLFLAAVGHSGGALLGGAEGTWVPTGLKKRSRGCGSSKWAVFSRTASGVWDAQVNEAWGGPTGSETRQGLSWRDGQEVGEAGESRKERLQGWWCSGHGEIQEDKN